MILSRTAKPLLMGILNVTPDSFSDGGQYNNPEAALNHARRMLDEGVDIIDIGGESTRPGAGRVPPDEQIKRVVPIIKQLQQEIPPGIPLSIDTTSTVVAGAALDNGASIINDVSAGRNDPRMFKLIAAAKVPCILMHMQGTPDMMQDNPQYDDVVVEIKSFLLERAAAAQKVGVSKENIVIDPGIGFGKSKQDNLDIIMNLDSFTGSGYPVLLGASRKRFMGSICHIESYSELVGASCATTALGVFVGVGIFRVHDVKENRQALDVAYALRESQRP